MEESMTKYGLSEIDEICLDAVTRAEEATASAILLLSHQYHTARWTAKYHGKTPIFVLSDNEKLLPQVEGLTQGCRGIRVEKKMTVVEAVEAVRHAGYELDSGVVILVDDWDQKVEMHEISI